MVHFRCTFGWVIRSPESPVLVVVGVVVVVRGRPVVCTCFGVITMFTTKCSLKAILSDSQLVLNESVSFNHCCFFPDYDH